MSKTRKAITVKTGKIYNVRHDRVVGFYASIGEVKERAGSVASACSQLQTRIESLPNVQGKLPYSGRVDHFVVIIVPEDQGSRTWIIGPGKDGVLDVHTGTTPETNALLVEASLRVHCAQMLWPGEKERAFAAVAPISNAREEFASWAEWQTKYADARQYGFDDSDARYIAGNCPQLVTNRELMERMTRDASSCPVCGDSVATHSYACTDSRVVGS